MHARGQYLVARCYEQGDGIAKNFEAAYESYKNAAERGDKKAQFRLAYFYCQGKGVNKDYGEAIEWLKKLSDVGEARAKYVLGVFYEEGIGGLQDIKKALEYYKEAAELGDASAQMRLGEFYEQGKVVKKSIEEARMWYRRAADQGNLEAPFMLDKLAKNIKSARVVSEEEQNNVDYVFRMETIWAFERPIDDVKERIKECEKYAETDTDILSQRRGAEKKIWNELLNKLQKHRAYLLNNRIGKMGDPLCTTIEEVEGYRDNLNGRIKKLINDVMANIEKDIRTSANPNSISEKRMRLFQI